jgi:MFS transporter, SP family, general alpha glucoside:H+ symporter
MASETNPKEGATPAAVENGPLEYTKYDQADLRDKVLTAEARQATATEHELSFTQAIRTYRRAAIWSIRTFPRYGTNRYGQTSKLTP